jgi:predicted flap endonuclease-1-like 5' DNA nuclease
MSSATSINTTSLWPSVRNCIEDLIRVKNSLKTHGAPKDLVSKAPFEVKSYRAWQVCLEKPAPGIIQVADAERILTAAPYEFSPKLIARILEVAEHGDIHETRELAAKYAISLAHTGPKNSNSAFTDESSNGTAPDNAAAQAANIEAVLAAQAANIEAVPKKLAEEGARPGDDKPVEQRRYDLQLIWGIGPRVAEKLEADGLTLTGLLDDWREFAAQDTLKGQTIDPSILKITPLPGQRKTDIAERLIRAGFKNLAKLTQDQLIGLKYYYDIGAKIPRDEIIRIQQILQTTAAELNQEMIAQCCGSYRRGRARSGDVDCLLFHKGLATEDDVRRWESENGHILSAFAAKLALLGFLVDHLSCGDTKYMGLCRMAGADRTNRRIDIRLMPMNSHAAALLYFTGSKNLNTDMRNRALARDMTLNEYGLYKFAKDPQGKIIKDSKGKNIKGEQLLTPTETDIFTQVGMKYLEPHERDI